MQQSAIRTNTNPATQPFIPAAETHQSVSSSPLQHVPKSVNGEGVKSSKPDNRSSAPDGRLCFCCKHPGHLKKDFQSSHTVTSAGQEDTYQQNALLSNRGTDQLMMDANFERKQGTKATRLTEKNGKDNRINPNSHIKTTDVSTVLVITKPMIALQDYNTRLLPLATILEVQVFIKTQINSQTLHLNIVHTHSNTLHKVNLLLA